MKQEYTKEFICRYWGGEWMTEDQLECTRFLFDLMGGSHHTFGKIKPCGWGIQINATSNIQLFATFDYSGLTTAVLMAHERSIRFQIAPSGPGMLRLIIHKRKREGEQSEKHPTIEEAIKNYNRSKK